MSVIRRDDQARAARIFGDAERIANSIADEFWKVSALRGIAQAAAAADPGRAARLLDYAERAACSVAEEPGKSFRHSG